MRKVVSSTRFERDLKRVRSRGLDLKRLSLVIEGIRINGSPPPSRRPHSLVGPWTGFMECHIGFDWLLIYQADADEVRLYRTGTHSDLFG